jgi:hypothetical protein
VDEPAVGPAFPSRDALGLSPEIIAGAVFRGGVMVLLVGSLRKQEVRTLMTVTVTGTARIQEFIIVATPVVSG